jgi:hypothetical protein
LNLRLLGIQSILVLWTLLGLNNPRLVAKPIDIATINDESQPSSVALMQSFRQKAADAVGASTRDRLFRDIYATQKSGVGETLLIVDCKRYSLENRVGVEIVRALYGLGEQKGATMALVATTSYFTRGAKEFQHAVRNRLSLRDYDHLIKWRAAYGVSGKESVRANV